MNEIRVPDAFAIISYILPLYLTLRKKQLLMKRIDNEINKDTISHQNPSGTIAISHWVDIFLLEPTGFPLLKYISQYPSHPQEENTEYEQTSFQMQPFLNREKRENREKIRTLKISIRCNAY